MRKSKFSEVQRSTDSGDLERGRGGDGRGGGCACRNATLATHLQRAACSPGRRQSASDGLQAAVAAAAVSIFGWYRLRGMDWGERVRGDTASDKLSRISALQRMRADGAKEMNLKSVLILFSAMFVMSSCKQGSTKEVSSASGVSRAEFFLPQNIVVDGQDYLPLPLRARSGQDGGWKPETLDQAADELVTMLPEYVSKREPTRREKAVCRLDSPGDVGAFELCEKEQCNRLPEISRGPSCNFFSQLATWTKEAWLGSFCSSAKKDEKSVLENWLFKRGVGSCAIGSELIQVAFFMRLENVGFDQDKIAKKYATFYGAEKLGRQQSPSNR